MRMPVETPEPEVDTSRASTKNYGKRPVQEYWERAVGMQVGRLEDSAALERSSSTLLLSLQLDELSDGSTESARLDLMKSHAAVGRGLRTVNRTAVAIPVIGGGPSRPSQVTPT